MASFVYDKYKQALHDRATGGGVDWDTDTIKVRLCASTYTPNQGTHQFVSDLTNEVGSSGTYTAGRAGNTALATPSVTNDTTNHVARLVAANVSWTSATITARYAVIYKDNAADASSLLIALIDFGSDQTSTAGTFQISWNASGIVTWTG